mmetsp:Transcript_70269/g.129510  ORF Transcript_70269/g.129510 Transcript_70269/m.129510 type:complete len:211 (-) Transcript_70269:38-670(-)
MAKPFGVRGTGNGGHFNFSLWKQEADGQRSNVTSESKSFLAGILNHAPALEALCSPTPPCYARHGNWAPTVANWGPDNRMTAVRTKADYWELRMPSAAANAYLVMAATIAAGMDGVRSGLECPPPAQTEDQGAKKLPTSLEEALQALEADKYMVSKLGEDLVRWFCMVKRGEIAAIEEKLPKGEGAPPQGSEEHDAALSAAWQHLYMEFI